MRKFRLLTLVTLLISIILVGCTQKNENYVRQDDSDTAREEVISEDVRKEKLEDQPANVIESYQDYEQNDWKEKSDKSKGTKDDSPFKNKEEKLPRQDDNGNDIEYREHDVNNKISGQGRDAERFVTGSDGSVYYTNDHYETFIKLE